MTERIIYLGSPYSHPDFSVRRDRYLAVTRAAVAIGRTGIRVYSPVTLGHIYDALSEHEIPYDWDYWAEMDRRFIRVCHELWIYCQDGWIQSRGVQRELAYAKTIGMPHRLLSPWDAICNNT